MSDATGAETATTCPRCHTGVARLAGAHWCPQGEFTAELGAEPAMFPGGHIAFAEDPDGFAPTLRKVLSGDTRS